MKSFFPPVNRRRFIRASAAFGLLAGLQCIVPAYALENAGLKAGAVGDPEANGIDLRAENVAVVFGMRLWF